MSSKRKSQPTKLMDDSPIFRTPQAPGPNPASLMFPMASSQPGAHFESLLQQLKSNDESVPGFKPPTNLHELAQLEYIRLLAHQQHQQHQQQQQQQQVSLEP